VNEVKAIDFLAVDQGELLGFLDPFGARTSTIRMFTEKIKDFGEGRYE